MQNINVGAQYITYNRLQRRKKGERSEKKSRKIKDEITADTYNGCNAYMHVHDVTWGTIESKLVVFFSCNLLAVN